MDIKYDEAPLKTCSRAENGKNVYFDSTLAVRVVQRLKPSRTTHLLQCLGLNLSGTLFGQGERLSHLI